MFDDEDAVSPLSPSTGSLGVEQIAGTPSNTEGETDNEEDVSEVSTPQQQVEAEDLSASRSATRSNYADSELETESFTKSSSYRVDAKPRMTMYELTTNYLQKPVVILANIDLFRATDFTFVLLFAYALLPNLFNPVLNKLPTMTLAVHFAHALAWRIFHSFGLGLLLRAQSNSKWLVRHFLKHYHYSAVKRKSFDGASSAEWEMDSNDDVVQSATRDAFNNWKVVYNVSLVMTYGEEQDDSFSITLPLLTYR